MYLYIYVLDSYLDNHIMKMLFIECDNAKWNR